MKPLLSHQVGFDINASVAAPPAPLPMQQGTVQPTYAPSPQQYERVAPPPQVLVNAPKRSFIADHPVITVGLSAGVGFAAGLGTGYLIWGQ